MSRLHVLTATNFCQSVAEEGTAELASYFVETEDWRRVYTGEVETVYGAKGSGKSATGGRRAQQPDCHVRNVP